MSGDIFLKLDGIDGESIKDGHKDSIEIGTFSWGESNPTSFEAGGGGGVGKVSIADIAVSKNMDKSSPNLYQACASGKHIKDAVITFRKAGEKPQEYLKIKLTDVMVSAIQLTDSAGFELGQESITLAFAAIKLEYKPQQADGTLGAAIPFGWSIKEHKADQ